MNFSSARRASLAVRIFSYLARSLVRRSRSAATSILLFVDDGDIEAGGAAGVVAGERLGGDLDGLDAGEAGEDVLA